MTLVTDVTEDLCIYTNLQMLKCFSNLLNSGAASRTASGAMACQQPMSRHKALGRGGTADKIRRFIWQIEISSVTNPRL